ncbi:MAG TPA: TetR/AcrR family transcriptional regulator C-terminal domain-containing protein [Gaiellaceae bacterium]|nr:TetR/AcrR family transcriptional regulator C-terminal domain-containing protein [Gaiellaceae bacterium]
MKSSARPPLSRDRVLRAAVALADAHGIDAIAMRRLGQELGVEAMSLYNHVANKDDLLDGMLDLVLAETEPPSHELTWDQAVRASALSVHAALTRHPWAVHLLLGARVLPARLAYMDSLLRELREAGFSADTTYHAYHVLDGHIFGFSLWEATHRFTPEQEASLSTLFEDVITEQAYPDLHEHGRRHFEAGPHRDVSAFEYGLDLILDGLRKLHAREARGG